MLLGSWVVKLRLNGKLMGWLSNTQVSHKFAAKMLQSMAKYDSLGKASQLTYVSVCEETTACNEQKLAG